MRLRLLCPLVLLPFATAFAAAPTSVMGYWATPDHSIVRIAPCGSGTSAPVCLTVVKVSPSAAPAPNGKLTDRQNPDAKLRDRALCGLMIGNGFQQTDAEHLTGGKLYDPNTGHTYSGTIASDGDTLHLHGFIGISLFGRTETWHRSAPTAACK